MLDQLRKRIHIACLSKSDKFCFGSFFQGQQCVPLLKSSLSVVVAKRSKRFPASELNLQSNRKDIWPQGLNLSSICKQADSLLLVKGRKTSAIVPIACTASKPISFGIPLGCDCSTMMCPLK